MSTASIVQIRCDGCGRSAAWELLTGQAGALAARRIAAPEGWTVATTRHGWTSQSKTARDYCPACSANQEPLP